MVRVNGCPDVDSKRCVLDIKESLKESLNLLVSKNKILIIIMLLSGLYLEVVYLHYLINQHEN